MFDNLFKDDGFFGRNGTIQKIGEVGGLLGQSRSDNAFDRIKGLTGLIAKVLGMF